MGVGSGGSLRDAPRRVQFGKPTSAGKGRLAGAGTEIEWEGASRPRPLTPPSMRVRTRRFASFDEVGNTFELNSSALGIASRHFRGLYASEVF